MLSSSDIEREFIPLVYHDIKKMSVYFHCLYKDSEVVMLGKTDRVTSLFFGKAVATLKLKQFVV